MPIHAPYPRPASPLAGLSAFCLPLGLSLVLLALGGCASLRVEQPTPELRRMAGQMLLVGFRGAEPTPDLPILGQVARLNLGGVILFDRDVALASPDRNIASPEQVSRLTAALQAAAAASGSPPLFIAVDQEGGRVQRLRAARGFSETPAAADLCPIVNSTPDPTPAMRAGEQAGRTLAGVGINLDFAPVADVNVNPQNPVIGGIGRSFASEPGAVAACAGAFAWGLQSQRVLTAAKHFPGHGSSRADSHLGYVDVTDSWTEDELLPFRELTRLGLADMVMTAHVFNARLDPDYPGTMSQKVIGGILRQRLGFEGVVVTDDLQMQAVAGHYGLKEYVRLIVNAGADVLLIGNNLDFDADIAEKILDTLMELVAEGKVTPERLRQSFERIRKLKLKLAAQAGTPAARPQAHKETPCTSCS